MLGENRLKSDQLRVFQIYNYELGLDAIEQALPASEKLDIPPRTNAYDPSVDTENEDGPRSIELGGRSLDK